MAAHAPMKNKVMEDKKCHNLMRWFIYCVKTVPGVDQWEVTSQGVNTLATWMIEHPQEVDQPEPPGGNSSSEGETTAAAQLDGATAAKRTNRYVYEP